MRGGEERESQGEGETVTVAREAAAGSVGPGDGDEGAATRNLERLWQPLPLRGWKLEAVRKRPWIRGG